MMSIIHFITFAHFWQVKTRTFSLTVKLCHAYIFVWENLWKDVLEQTAFAEFMEKL